jgi:hypothetical protein
MLITTTKPAKNLPVALCLNYEHLPLESLGACINFYFCALDSLRYIRCKETVQT